MHPILIHIGALRVYSYGFFMALGILAAAYVLVKKVEKQDLDPQFVIDLVLILAIAGIVGARLFYILLYNRQYYFTHPLHILMLQEGGLAFYGGLILALLAAYFYVKKIGMPYLYLLDLASPVVGLGYAITRLGCFFNGCCYGKVTTLPWGMVFPVVDDLPRQPTQLYSVLAGLLIFGILTYLTPKSRFRGQIFSLFLIIYGITRSLIELCRENDALRGGPPVAALAALVIAIAGGVLYYIQYRKAIPPQLR